MQAAGGRELKSALQAIESKVNTSAFRHGTPVTLFNTLSWERTDLATVPLPENDTSSYAVFDARGREVPSQTVAQDPYQRDLLFVAGPVPPLGYATYELRKERDAAGVRRLRRPPGAWKTRCSGSPSTSTGWVKSIMDKRNGREILSGSGNELQLLEDVPKAVGRLEHRLDRTNLPVDVPRRRSGRTGSGPNGRPAPPRLPQAGCEERFPDGRFPELVLHAGHHPVPRPRPDRLHDAMPTGGKTRRC